MNNINKYTWPCSDDGSLHSHIANRLYGLQDRPKLARKAYQQYMCVRPMETYNKAVFFALGSYEPPLAH